jgi:hypothetical protein
MLITSVLVFAMSTFFISFILGNTTKGDKGKVAAFMTLIAWGSLLCGLYIAKLLGIKQE